MLLFYFILIYSSEAKVFQATEYPLRVEDGASWRQFWWYNSAGGWPLDENDTLGTQFGCCDPAALHCFGRLPQYLSEDQSELLAVDLGGNFYRWAFDSTSITAHAVWQAFHDHIPTEYPDVRNTDEWRPNILSGGPCRRQDCWMYRWEHGVKSFILDDDSCDCYSTLSAGHGVCFEGFLPQYGIENQFGVGLLNEAGCDTTSSPSPSNSLFLYYKEGTSEVVATAEPLTCKELTTLAPTTAEPTTTETRNALEEAIAGETTTILNEMTTTDTTTVAPATIAPTDFLSDKVLAASVFTTGGVVVTGAAVAVVIALVYKPAALASAAGSKIAPAVINLPTVVVK